jgi:hypothetical protein
MNNKENVEFIEKQLSLIDNICKLHEEIKGLDKSLEQLYPIAVVDNNVFFVFDLDYTGKKYEYKMECPSKMEIPVGVLAAFPLEFYENKISAVIFPEALENIEYNVFIFHEFVHCFQYNYYEMDIKKTLHVAQDAMERQDYMWELNYPFPYDDEGFIKRTFELNKGYNIKKYHKEMKGELKEKDFEYMIWQEWKEGYARYIENLVRAKLGLKRESKIMTLPFDRVCFYEIGSRYIETLLNNDISIKNDLKKLFNKIKYCEV